MSEIELVDGSRVLTGEEVLYCTVEESKDKIGRRRSKPVEVRAVLLKVIDGAEGVVNVRVVRTDEVHRGVARQIGDNTPSWKPIE